MVTDGLNFLNLLLFLGAALGSVAALAVWLFALSSGRRPLARGIARLEGVALAAYAVLLLGGSALSHGRALALGQEKHICEIDCHTAYAVVHVDTARTIGTGALARTAHEGQAFYIVTLRVRFDSATISPRRGMAPLTPGPRVLRVADQNGTSYEPSADGQQALAASEGAPVPLTKPLIPGERYTTKVVFELPAGLTAPRLFVGAQAGLPDAFLIGYENSLLHGKVTFRLDG